MSETDTSPAAGRSVEYYWRPGCPFCMMLGRALKKHDIEVNPHNIWDEPEAAATVRRAAGGNETVPTVGLGGEYLVNPSIEEVVTLIRRQDPQWAADLDLPTSRLPWRR